MRKTRLMQLAEAYGDRGAGTLISGTIDGVVYLLSERAESIFGPRMIDILKKDIALTQSGFPKKKSLEIITGNFIKNYLAADLKNARVDKIADELSKLKPLSSDTYVDYFVALTMLEHGASRTPLAKAVSRVSSILTGYQTESAYPVCDGIVQFFHDTDNAGGCVDLISDLCKEIKKYSAI